MNKGKLHLSRQGSSFLANNFKKFANALWTSEPLLKTCPNIHEHPMNSLDGIKSRRIHNPKIDESFPTAQFLLQGYHKPYRLDISDKQRGLLIYIKAHLPSTLLSNHISPKDIQVIPFELNIRKEKRMFVCIYRPPRQGS